MQKAFIFRRVLHELTDKAKHIREKLDNFLTMAINHRQTILYSKGGEKLSVFMHVHFCDKLSYKLVNQAYFFTSTEWNGSRRTK